MHRLILYLFPLLFFVVSCRKVETDANNDTQGYAESQVVGTWKITGLIGDIPYDWDGNGIPETNLFPATPACDKDNLYIFDPDKTGDFKRNCNTTQDGIWEVFQTKFLLITPTAAPAEMEKITSMSSMQFVTEKQVVAPSGQTITLSKIWTRQ